MSYHDYDEIRDLYLSENHFTSTILLFKGLLPKFTYGFMFTRVTERGVGFATNDICHFKTDDE